MVNSFSMTEHFESSKNMRASGYTALVVVCLLVLFFFVRWSLPPMPPPVPEEGMEVNLGSSDQGLGTDQPFEPGDPAPKEQQTYTPPQQNVAENNDTKEVETDDDNKEDAPVVKKPPVVKPDAKKLPEKDVVKNINKLR